MKYIKKLNLKIKVIAIIYGVICHSTFFLAGLSMLWVLYYGFTVSFGYFDVIKLRRLPEGASLRGAKLLIILVL